ncbi:MAG: hypothetical protein ACYSWO_05055 [Planctomycetota bacterium]|jgi:hypothetical protein
MMRLRSQCSGLLLLGVCFGFCGLTGCWNPFIGPTGPVALQFSLKLDPQVYSQSHYKKPPQFAIWIEDSAGEKIRTVWVSEKTGAGSWGGKTVRPVSLPFWASRWQKETGNSGDPTPENPAADAVTEATPKNNLICRTEVPGGTRWNCFIEVNVSGDFNDSFVAASKDGKRDRNGNGQPSIIYKASIKASPGGSSSPKLIGRTDQFESVSSIIADLEGITDAKNLFLKIEITAL